MNAWLNFNIHCFQSFQVYENQHGALQMEFEFITADTVMQYIIKLTRVVEWNIYTLLSDALALLFDGRAGNDTYFLG